MEKSLAGCKEVTLVQTLDLCDLSRKNANLLNPRIKHLSESQFSRLHHGVIPSFLCVFKEKEPWGGRDDFLGWVLLVCRRTLTKPERSSGNGKYHQTREFSAQLDGPAQFLLVQSLMAVLAQLLVPFFHAQPLPCSQRMRECQLRPTGHKPFWGVLQQVGFILLPLKTQTLRPHLQWGAISSHVGTTWKVPPSRSELQTRELWVRRAAGFTSPLLSPSFFLPFSLFPPPMAMFLPPMLTCLCFALPDGLAEQNQEKEGNPQTRIPLCGHMRKHP